MWAEVMKEEINFLTQNEAVTLIPVPSGKQVVGGHWVDLPLISNPLLNIINLSLVTGYVPQSFKVAVIKLLLKNLP